jgi:hypothetical protein
MIALEAAIEQSLKELIPQVSDHHEATAILTNFQAVSKNQRQALEARLNAIADNPPQLQVPATDFAIPGLSENENHPVSTVLQIIYTMLNQAVIGYSVLHPLSTRFLDSSWIADEGTSFHLSRQHTQNYVHAIQQISHLLHDVVLWELDQEGLECQCVCPSCGVGICLCSIAGRSFLSAAWDEAGPIANDEGIYVQLPKQDSAAAKAGLRRGDVILATGGKKFERYGEIQGAVRDTEPGEEIHLTVRRSSDEMEEVAVIHP